MLYEFIVQITLIRFELLLNQWANEPLEMPEENTTTIPCSSPVDDELGTKWNNPDAALQLLRMKIRTSR